MLRLPTVAELAELRRRDQEEAAQAAQAQVTKQSGNRETPEEPRPVSGPSNDAIVTGTRTPKTASADTADASRNRETLESDSGDNFSRILDRIRKGN
jgi:hypothetical protein